MGNIVIFGVNDIMCCQIRMYARSVVVWLK